MGKGPKAKAKGGKASLSGGKERSVRVEKIENGFLITQETFDTKKGEFETRKRFSETEPTIGLDDLA